jgi:hypothetical protein
MFVDRKWTCREPSGARVVPPGLRPPVGIMDPTYAAAIGVDTSRLLLSQPDHGEQALEILNPPVRSNEARWSWSTRSRVDAAGRARKGRWVMRPACFAGPFSIAGAGFEPATFGL